MKMVKPIATSKVTPRNQISLLKEVRQKIGAEVGDYILFFDHDQGVLINTEGLKNDPPPGYHEIKELSDNVSLHHSPTTDTFLLFNHSKGTLFLLEKEEIDALMHIKLE